MTDPRMRGMASPGSSKADDEVAEGVELLLESLQDLMARPKAEREAHIRGLLEKIAEVLPRFEAADKGGPSATRLRAMEGILQMMADATAREADPDGS